MTKRKGRVKFIANTKIQCTTVGNAIATSVEDSTAVQEGDEFTEGQSVMCANILCKQVFDFFVVVVIVYFWNGGSLYSCFICDLWLCMVSY